MKILFFTKGDKYVGSSRQRIWFIAERLKENYGIEYEIIHSIKYSSWLFFSRSRKIQITSVKRKIKDKSFDILYVHKSLFPLDLILRIIKEALHGRRFIYDLDDGEWLHAPFKSWLLARFAEQVVTGSHGIYDWAKKHNKNVIFVPTVIDHEMYRKYAVTHEKRDIYTIGWVGTAKGHFMDGNFTIVRDTLEMLSKKVVKFRFVVVGSQHYEPLKKYFAACPFETVYIDELDWRDPSCTPEIIQKYQFDVGLLPLVDIPVSRAKCAYKAIEYMACGVPVLTNSVGENKIVVQDKITGFVADTAKEWADLVAKLLSDKNLRVQMGEAGMERVQTIYSYEAVMPQYAEILSLKNVQ